MKKITLITIWMLMTVWGQSQNEFYHPGDITVIQDNRVDTLVHYHKILNQKFPEIEGYRIMLYFESGNNSKDSAYSVKERFMEKYKTIPAYVTFNPPYYRVHAGNFRTKIEAEAVLHRLEETYPNAWVVQSLIEPPQID